MVKPFLKFNLRIKLEKSRTSRTWYQNPSVHRGLGATTNSEDIDVNMDVTIMSHL